MKDKNDGWRKHNEPIRHRAASGHPAALPDVSPLTKAAQIFAALPQTGAKQRRHPRPTDPHTLFLKRAARIKLGEEDTFIDRQIESFRYRASLLEPCNTEEASLWLGYAQALEDVKGIWGVPVATER